MKIGKKVTIYLFWVCLANVALTSPSLAQDISSLDQKVIEKTIHGYASSLNEKKWVEAANHLYISQCKADTQSVFVEFFESMYGQRLRTSLNIEKVG